MAEQVVIPSGRPAGPRARARDFLRGRRLTLATALALAEVLFIVFGDPGVAIGTLAAVLLLVLALALVARLRPGLLRDVLWIVAIAQAMVVLVPVLLGVGFAVALVFAVVVLVGVLLVAIRFRV